MSKQRDGKSLEVVTVIKICVFKENSGSLVGGGDDKNSIFLVVFSLLLMPVP